MSISHFFHHFEYSFSNHKEEPLATQPIEFSGCDSNVSKKVTKTNFWLL